MRILIAADMEGISGVVHWDHVDHKHDEYKRFRRLMTTDVNAAIRGAYDAGAEAVTVADGHGTFRNILIEELDPRARLNSGAPRSLAMLQGLDLAIDGAMFIGYHARVGTPNAILDHTWSSSCIAGVWINGQALGEIGINAAVCGHFGVPVIMISGDQSACAEAVELLGAIEFAIVKRATGRMSAECQPPERAQEGIYRSAKQAVERLVAGGVPRPLSIDLPVSVSIEMVSSDMADRAAVLPGADRPEGKRVTYEAEDMPSAYRAMRAMAALAHG